jgi:hypothetical protein
MQDPVGEPLLYPLLDPVEDPPVEVELGGEEGGGAIIGTIDIFLYAPETGCAITLARSPRRRRIRIVF